MDEQQDGPRIVHLPRRVRQALLSAMTRELTKATEKKERELIEKIQAAQPETRQQRRQRARRNK